MKFFKLIITIPCTALLVLLAVSCDKVNIDFGDAALGSDPNITYLDNYKADIFTFKPDSFSTSGNEVLSLGYHYDSVFGVVKAGAYAQLNLPSPNPLLNDPLTVTYDSLELIIKPNGAFYGDSTKPFKVSIYQLTQNITNPVNGAGDIYYNCSSFGYNPTPIGQQVINLNGNSGTYIHIRLSDVLGQDLLTRFKNNDDNITTSEKFLAYFKGIYITTDSTVTKTIAYFSAPADSVMVRLSYHDNALFPVEKSIDFNYYKAKQFNNLNFRYTNSAFSAFINNKAQLIPSSLSGNKSFLNTNLTSSIKITFPTILNLKELHPYIKIVKAELVIAPDPASYAYPYNLPPVLNLYTTDENNYPVIPFLIAGTSSQQTGNLYIDYLYGENTNYTYDITSFINTLISEGQFSTSAILLTSSLTDYDSGSQRLILHDQTSNHSVQLKLYVLGL